MLVRRVGGAERQRIRQIRPVGREDQVEAVEIIPNEQPGTKIRNIGPTATRLGLRATIGRMADMPVAGTRRINRRIDPRAAKGGASGAFGKRRAADIAEAEKQDGGRSFLSIVAHMFQLSRKVEPTFNLHLLPALLAMLDTR